MVCAVATPGLTIVDGFAELSFSSAACSEKPLAGFSVVHIRRRMGNGNVV